MINGKSQNNLELSNALSFCRFNTDLGQDQNISFRSKSHFTKLTFGLQIYQKTNKITVRISVLASKKRSNKKEHFMPLIGGFHIASLTLPFWFDLLLEFWGRNPYKNFVFFWSISRNQQDISKLTDLYKLILVQIWPFLSSKLSICMSLEPMSFYEFA